MEEEGGGVVVPTEWSFLTANDKVDPSVPTNGDHIGRGVKAGHTLPIHFRT